MSMTHETATARRQLLRIERGIIGLSLLTLVLIFQPFSEIAFRIGLGGVIFVGLLFNLVPLIPGASRPRDLIKPLVIITVAFLFITGLAMVTAFVFAAVGT